MEQSKNQNHLLVAVICIGIISFLGLLLQVFHKGPVPVAFTGSGSQGIVVSGAGTIIVKPDIARISMGVEAEAATAKEAQAKSTEAMTRIIAGLKNLGLEGKDIQTTDFSLYPNRQYIKEENRDKVVGYRAVNQVTVTVRDLGKLGEAIDRSIQAGANNINNVAFSVESPEQWRRKAIARAIKDARGKAEEMAEAAGVKIKRISTVTESAVDLRPYMMDGFRNKQVLGAGEASTPMEPGNVKVTANIQMSLEI